MPETLLTKDQIAAVNQMMKAKWDNGGDHIKLDGPIPATPEDMTSEHYSKAIAVGLSTIEDAPANYRAAQFVIFEHGDVAVLFHNIEIWIVDENWFPDPEESFLLRLRPKFSTAEEAFEWIRSGVFMLFSATTDSVLVINGDYQLVAEWSLADDFARCQNPKGTEQLNIHLDCNEQMAREASEQGHIDALREKVKAITGIYPQDAVKQHYKEILERQEREQEKKREARKNAKQARRRNKHD